MLTEVKPSTGEVTNQEASSRFCSVCPVATGLLGLKCVVSPKSPDGSIRQIVKVDKKGIESTATSKDISNLVRSNKTRCTMQLTN